MPKEEIETYLESNEVASILTTAIQELKLVASHWGGQKNQC